MKMNSNEILEVYKSMGMPKINEGNMEFLLDMMKKLELDKKLKQEGLKEGMEKGMEEGIEKGMEKGIGKGMEEGIKKLILKQHKKGLSVEYIADINDIDVEYVKKIVK